MTLPETAAPPVVLVRLAVSVTVPPYVPEAAPATRVVPGIKVAVSDWFELLRLNVHGEAVPVHDVDPPELNVPDQPKNTEPALGVTVKVPVALLSSEFAQLP